VELHEELGQQSKLGNGVEYQGSKSQGFEYDGRKVEEAQEELESAEKALREAGLVGFEGVYEPDNLGNNYALCVEHGSEKSKAGKKRRLAEQKEN
jgi:hypothetical protein